MSCCLSTSTTPAAIRSGVEVFVTFEASSLNGLSGSHGIHAATCTVAPFSTTAATTLGDECRVEAGGQIATEQTTHVVVSSLAIPCIAIVGAGSIAISATATTNRTASVVSTVHTIATEARRKWCLHTWHVDHRVLAKGHHVHAHVLQAKSTGRTRIEMMIVR